MRKSIALSLRLILVVSILFVDIIAFAQNVGIGASNPNASALLELRDSSRGFLPPRMTFAQRNAISNPAQGLIIYCTDCGTNGGEPQFYNGTNWLNMIGGTAKEGSANLPSVTISTQIWSSKNLDVATYRNGDPIPQVTDPTQWANLTTGAWCWYNNDSATYAATYGRLYNWYAVNDPRGLAPQGWHVPNEADWNKLVKYLDAAADTTCQGCIQSTVAGGAMKSTTGWISPNTGATNSSGFAGLPGGARYDDGTFDAVGYYGVWWSASEYVTTSAWARALGYNVSHVGRYYYLKTIGFSVRVVRD
jgi:uncharacterized protein (TIGR02145 family)